MTDYLALEKAAVDFVQKVDRGEARSIRSYVAFKNALEDKSARMKGDQFFNLRRANIERDAEWNPNKLLSLSFRGNELGGEIGEAQNILKKLECERLGLVGSRSTPEALAEELADGHICLDLIAMEFGIDSWEAIVKKFNKTSEERGLSIRL